MITVIIILFLLTCAFWYYQLNKLSRIERNHFGDDDTKRENREFKNLKRLNYLKQQKGAFRLLCFSITMSMALASWLILNIINGHFDSNLLQQAIGLGGGVVFSSSSFRLYRIASDKLK